MENTESEEIKAIRLLYPNVDQEKTPLPKSWNSKDKYNFLGLYDENLRVHYKGVGKTHKDAASVRATHSIPASCGVYYFEVKIINKGRDGYMGIGLSSQNVNLNRLPGWDKNSYGYHGDDGRSFCSSGTGQPYGPTFTTGDIIGCGLNLIDNSVFYTKNGLNLGVAFTNIPSNMYPTVGLQTLGETIHTNFGQKPFIFDFMDLRMEMYCKMNVNIKEFELCNYFNWPSNVQNIILEYMVHQGYSKSSLKFSECISKNIKEQDANLSNRQKISNLILSGKIGKALCLIESLYPDLLPNKPNLLLKLKCQQFIEMIILSSESRISKSGVLSSTPPSSASSSSPFSSTNPLPSSQESSDNPEDACHNEHSVNFVQSDHPFLFENGEDVLAKDKDFMAQDLSKLNNCNEKRSDNYLHSSLHNGNNEVQAYRNSSNVKGKERDGTQLSNKTSTLYAQKIEEIIAFGRELYALNSKLENEHGKNQMNERMIGEAFSLLAYADPRLSSLGHLFKPDERESLANAINSVILESLFLPKYSQLELISCQAKSNMSSMITANMGKSAFINFNEIIS